MANNLAISITADVADLTAKMAVAQVAVKDYGKAMRDVAREVAAGDTSDFTKAKLLEVSDAYSKASSQVAVYKREMASAKGPQDQVTASAGSMKAGMQSLSYQINDVATMFALGAPPMQIFASQGSQVIQSLQMMNGGAKGLLGVLGGPWGTAMIVAATALTPFISKLLETGDAADKAKEKVYGLRDALADIRTKPMEAIGKLNLNVIQAEAKLRQAQAMPRYTGGGSEEYKRNTHAERSRREAIADAQLELDGARSALAVAKSVEQTNQSLFEITAKAGRLRARSIKEEDDNAGGGSKRKGRGSGAKSKSDREAEAEAKKAAREQADAERDALQERLEVTRQQESIAEGAAQTEIELSRLVLDSKLADIEAEQRNGQISDAQALQRKAVLYAQMDQLDIEHENRIYAARLKQLRDEQANYGQKTQEYRAYLRRIEELEAQHKNRLRVLDAQAGARRRQQERLTATESNRRMTGMANTWAQNLARMATLQQGFGATVKGMWQGLVGIVTDVVAQIIEQWIIGEMIKMGLVKMTSQSTIATEAAKAGAGGTASMAAAPFPLNMSAPAFGASMYASAMAYSGAAMAGFAKGTNELPNDMIAQIHAGERIVPKADNDVLLELTKRGAMMGAMGPGAPKSGMQGGGSEGVHVHLHGTVIHGTRDLKKFAESNAAQLSAAGRKYVRNNGRG
jgi:hypothetical protein